MADGPAIQPHIEYMRLSEVEAAFAKRNPRRHDVPAIAASIKARGFNAPPLLNEKTARLVYGHGRTKALRLLCDEDPQATPVRINRAEDGEWTLPVLRGVSFRTRNEAEEYLVADNRIAELSSWEPEGIAAILERIRDRGKLEGTGYVSRDVDRLLRELRKGGRAGALESPTPAPPTKPTTKPGDLWAMGGHRLLCGDATAEGTYGLLMGDTKADMVWTDPPYGVSFSGAGGKAIEGDITNTAITGFFPLAVARTVPGGAIYMCGGSTNVPLYFKVFELFCRSLPAICVWDKEHFVLRRHGYHSRFEFIFYGWAPGGGNRTEYWFGDRKQPDIWNVRREPNEFHPTQKPVPLISIAIERSAPEGGIVLEPFAGSGSAIIACEELGRLCMAVEISPAYCDVIVQRWEALTGKKATRAKPASSHDKSGASRRTVEAGGA